MDIRCRLGWHAWKIVRVPGPRGYITYCTRCGRTR